LVSVIVVYNDDGGRTGAWPDGRRMDSRVADTARRASTVTSRYGNTLFFIERT